MMKKVFVSGCFDMLHSGHVAFIKKAAELGDVYVGIGSDKTITDLKGRPPINCEAERLYMIESLKDVKSASINSGNGILDFEKDIIELKPDILYVNTDGHSPLKEQLCKKYNIKYVVNNRTPHDCFKPRSTSAIVKECKIPYRIDLAGGWLDQHFINKHCPGPVITCSIEPEIIFNEFSGMASSTRRRAIGLWGNEIPTGNREKLARQLFCYDNEPRTDKHYISGSQDSLGICLPGINRLYYDNSYWPCCIENINDEDIIQWLENILWLVPLYPRSKDLDLYSNINIDLENIQNLSWHSDAVWQAIKEKNTEVFANSFLEAFKSQIKIFPKMIDDRIWNIIEKYVTTVAGYKLSGAGGGGYLILVSETPVADAFKIKITR